MSADTVWVTLLAAVFGALAAGGYDHYLRRQERNEERSAILNAICSEVSIICRLVRDSDFSDQIDNVLRMNIASREANRSIVYNFQVYMDQDYFVVFESLAPKVGFLNPEHAQIIVQFYGLAKIAIDCLHRDGIDYDVEELGDAIENLEKAKGVLVELLEVGDKIVQLRRNYTS